MLRPEALRWRVARLLNRLPGQCWSDLVEWALRGGVREARSPWSPQTSTCWLDSVRTGACYCGKLRLPRAGANRG